MYFFLLSACSSDQKKPTEIISPESSNSENEENKSLLQKDSTLTFIANSLLAQVQKESDYFKIENDTIHFFKILTQGLDTLPLHSVVDPNSFDVLGRNEKDRRKIRNPYYLDRGMNYYYKDKSLFYIYQDQGEPDFFVLDSVGNVELMGGAYIRTNSKVYYRGFEIEDASSKTFGTFDIIQPKSEWKLTIGFDDNNIFLGKEKMNKAQFDRLLWYNDSLKRIYFPE